jgi:rubredoxin
MSEQAIEETALDRHECLACGYVYEPEKGDNKRKIAPGTAFADLPVSWKCPNCSAPKAAFANVGEKDGPSGFKENLKYGFGVNTLKSDQKNLLIFGLLALFAIFFLSLYGLQ